MKPAYRKAGEHRTTIEKASARLPVFGCICVCLTALFFCYLAVNAPSIHRDLRWEDSWVENFTAIWLCLAGLLLIATAFVERRILPRLIYIFSGIALLFGAGEEISWGQRIFGFHTPGYFLNLNSQHETNIHNMQALMKFHHIDRYGTLIFCIVIYAAYFHKKDVIFGVPLPSIPLMFGFMIMLQHNVTRYAPVKLADSLISSPSIVLLLLFIIYMLFERKYHLVIAATAIMISALVISIVYSFELRARIRTSPDEIREYLFSFCYLLYALELLLIRIRQTEKR